MTIINLGRKSSVNVGVQNRNIVLFGKHHTLAQLNFNALFSLVVTGITSINHTVHKITSVRIVARMEELINRFLIRVWFEKP